MDIEVGVPHRPDMREIGLAERIAFLLELLYRRGHVNGILHNDGIGDQIQATGLMGERLSTRVPQVALIRDHQERSEVVQRLAFVQLPPPSLRGQTGWGGV
jgi:hypothetical protein